MRATEVVKVTGGEPPVEGGRGGVVAPLEGGQTGLDCAPGAASSLASRCPRAQSRPVWPPSSGATTPPRPPSTGGSPPVTLTTSVARIDSHEQAPITDGLRLQTVIRTYYAGSRADRRGPVGR